MSQPCDTHVQLCAEMRRWHDALNDGHMERDRDAVFSNGTWDAVRRSGLLRIPFGAEWGGRGHGLIPTMHVLEDLGHGCRDSGSVFSAVTHMVSVGVPLQRFASRELQDRYMPDVCDGSRIGAHAITEPEGGSDAMNMRMRALPDGDSFVLSGTKAFVTNGPVAGLLMIYARTEEGTGPFTVTAFLVERETPGLVVGEAMDKMGLRTSPLAELTLDGCRVPRENIVGKLGGGFLVFDHVMKWEILCTFAFAVGKMRYRLERCLDFARKRVQFGQSIGSFQSIANKLVDMKIGMETSRKWLFDAADRVTANDRAVIDIAIAKLVTSEQDVSSAMDAIQIFGGRGYLTSHGLEKDLRDAVAGTIYSGTSEIQRQRIATMLGL
jgi:alkylation response protein AidB-like acyl-CoA dehydrogenase